MKKNPKPGAIALAALAPPISRATSRMRVIAVRMFSPDSRTPGYLSRRRAIELRNKTSIMITNAPRIPASQTWGTNRPTTNTSVKPTGPYTPVAMPVLATSGINPTARARAAIAASVCCPLASRFKEMGSPAITNRLVAMAIKPPITMK